MTNKQRAAMAVDLLKKEYPDAICSLTYEQPYQLLLATRLSAQCTDARVNVVTKVLFQKYPTIQSLAEADITDIENIIKSCGLYKTKAKDLKNICIMLLENYHGTIPNTIEELTKLPGVGRKTANLVMGDIFHQPAVVCDTHCIRITNLLGLSTTKDPLKTEKELRAVLPPEESSDFCHRMVLHGRAVCKARTPACDICCLKVCCKHYITKEGTQK